MPFISQDIIKPFKDILFNQAAYMQANEIKNPMIFEWEESGCKIKITFSIEGDKANSLPKAPFAGFYIHGSLTAAMATRMIDDLLEFLLRRNIKTLNIRERINYHQPLEESILHQALINHPFECFTEINQHVFLKSKSGIQLHPMQLRKIKKCRNEGLIFKKDSLDEIKQVYKFLSVCRKQQGLKINIDEKKLIHLFSVLPNSYESYSIRNDQNEILAATVVVLLNDQVAYNYLPAFDRKHSQLSPLSFLLNELYQDLNCRNFEVFDLGISSIDGKAQKGLFTYKERMGAISSHRYIYQKIIK